jgi:hypothetical protein
MMVPSSPELSPVLRILLRAIAVLSLILGAVLFFVPGWASANFAWRVSPMVVMTMGGWFGGNALIAWVTAKVATWRRVYPSMIYLGMFGLLELLVLVVFRDRVVLGALLAWPYMITLVLCLLAGSVALAEWLRLRPAREPSGTPVTRGERGGIIFFVVFVAFLAIGGGIAGTGGISTEGLVFPEKLTLFTVRAFAAYFASLALGAIPLLWTRGVDPLLHYGRTGLALIVLIMIAAMIHWGAFDLAARPGGLLYLGAYIGTFIVTTRILLHHRRFTTPQLQTT